MVNFDSFSLSNGLRVIVVEDKMTSKAVFNLMYDIGSRDEDEHRTGFAHLFEHLMFEGSQNVSSFDEALQLVGGTSNAYTSQDITNYYITLPAVNLETAFWVESDRMLHLNVTEESLENQKSVVIEEFKQRYLNQPYGDIWLKILPLAYQKYPYKWPTIGKEIKHIEEATLEDVKAFGDKYYTPSNAVLVVGGNVEFDEVKRLAVKWFGEIDQEEHFFRGLKKEPKQEEARFLEVEANVNNDVIYKAYQMCERLGHDYYPTDLLSDILGGGETSRLYQHLVKGKQVFSSVGSFVSGYAEKGLFFIAGYLKEGVSFQEAEEAIEEVLEAIRIELVEEEELFRVKNQAESSILHSHLDLHTRCVALAHGTILGNMNLVNEESLYLQQVTQEDIQRVAQQILRKENCSTLHYKALLKEQTN
ncbi:MAG: insulinase family protein [Cytophagales bacterium]|nr:insulinase family protein [Cytophagales bacterium]